MVIKIVYPRTDAGIKNCIQHRNDINKYYKSYTQPFPQAEILVTIKSAFLWFNK